MNIVNSVFDQRKISMLTEFNWPLLQALTESNAIEQEYDAESLLDSLRAWEFLIQFNSLNHDLILNIHMFLMRTRKTIENKWKGKYRDCDIYIGGHKGVDPSMISGEMDEWIKKMNEMIKARWSESDTLETENQIIRLHIDYERIHPFQDGNGRTGRMFMNWAFNRLGLPIYIVFEAEKHKYYQWFRRNDEEVSRKSRTYLPK